MLPMIPGVPGRRSSGYVRHGTVDLSAVLDIAASKVIGKLAAQHRVIDFRDFPGRIDRQVDPGLEVHVTCDNLSVHKASAVHRWLLAASPPVSGQAGLRSLRPRAPTPRPPHPPMRVMFEAAEVPRRTATIPVDRVW